MEPIDPMLLDAGPRILSWPEIFLLAAVVIEGLAFFATCFYCIVWMPMWRSND